MRKYEGRRVIHAPTKENATYSALENGFIGSIYQAYNNHLPILFKPDDVWVAITSAFSTAVNGNPDSYRSRMVKHQGKKKLEIQVPYVIENANWNDFVDRFIKEIEKNSAEDLRIWFEPNFSTTSPQDKIVGQLVMMGAMKKFFEYSASGCTCGIPKVTMLGTLDDWTSIKLRLAKLKEFGLESWAQCLE